MVRFPINWNIVSAETRSKYIPILQDQIYTAIPFLILLDRDDRIVLDGGVDVREPILTAQEPFTWSIVAPRLGDEDECISAKYLGHLGLAEIIRGKQVLH